VNNESGSEDRMGHSEAKKDERKFKLEKEDLRKAKRKNLASAMG
jgi:hypothetical protein